MEWHFRLGYAVLALLLFRLLWGFVGGRWSRFAAFVYGPRSVVAYLRGRAHPDHLIGHTPLGALSVFAVLAILAFQVATGLDGRRRDLGVRAARAFRLGRGRAAWPRVGTRRRASGP